MHTGSRLVKHARIQQLRREFELLEFKEGGRSLGLLALSHNLDDAAEGARPSDGGHDVVAKFIRIVPPKFSQLAPSIETPVDLDTLMIEDVVGQFKVQEDRQA
ncbi:hypothetical protein U9M48_009348 [Paspalum notatum var. saurae]|uniref:Uncharacterized protein n=1 Tax=Paspalum notatum var. saurae TaxID=547442 RepID=A0AAQ3WF03_PASNO